MEIRIWRHFDMWLLLSTLALVSLGLALIYSATWGGEPGLPKDDTVYRQTAYLLLGLSLMTAVIFVDYRLLSSIAWPLYIFCLALLGATMVSGFVSYGAQRWLDLRFFPLQPSELAKIALIVMLARYLARHEERMGRLRYVLGSMVILAFPAGLVLMQPHLGTTIVLGVIWFGMVLAAGLRLLHILLFALSAVAASPLVWTVMPSYMQERVSLFLSPGEADPLNELYNIRQALISIGSGGLWGRGYMSGTQSQLHFLRVRHTDFVFSVLAEELGFIGACLLLLLLMVLVWRALRVATLSRDPFGRYMAVGVVSYLLFQALVNIGMNVRLLPVVGIPLPFVSYGGSSLITGLVCIGILQSIVMRHKRLEF